MWDWAKNAVGITEPIYGPSAIQSVTEQTKHTPYTELTKDDLAWERMDTTNVETKTFYMLSNEGRVGMAQIIYSNVLGVRTTAQFTSKVFSSEPGKNGHRWSSDNIHHFTFSPDGQNFVADACSMELSADGTSYAIKGNMNPRHSNVVDLTFTRLAPGIAIGKTGTTSFGTDPAKPWGRMKHLFWPRCSVSGSIVTPDGTAVNFTGKGMFVHALQGMKPHFAAARWNFGLFQGPTMSGFVMEFTTPKSYGETVVTVGAVVRDEGIVVAGADKVNHSSIKGDPDNDWPEPGAVEFGWAGEDEEGRMVTARMATELAERSDRVDVMGELPKFVKQIVAGASGTKPYIYQYTPKITLKVDEGGEKKEEDGQLFMEATFIS